MAPSKSPLAERCLNSDNLAMIKRRWIVALSLVAIMAVAWVLLARGRIPDPLFKGQRESDWIKNLKYLDDNQVVGGARPGAVVWAVPTKSSRDIPAPHAEC
jgi:hypothetical protein